MAELPRYTGFILLCLALAIPYYFYLRYCLLDFLRYRRLRG